MTGEVWTFFIRFFEQIWRLFNSWYFPGTNITPAAIGISFLFIDIVVRFVRALISIYPVQAASERRGEAKERRKQKERSRS